MRKSFAISVFLALVAAPVGAATLPDALSTHDVGMHAAAERVQDVQAFLAARSFDAASIPHHQVSTLADAGPGSLREAIEAANAQPGMALIEFAPSLEGRITLTTNSLAIYDSVVIMGPGAERLTVDGNNRFGVFWIQMSVAEHRPDVLLAGLGIAGGFAPLGAGIYSALANLTLTDCVIRDNSNNSAGLADKYGGGIYQYKGTLSIDRCKLSGNSAGNFGGGIAVENAALTVQDSIVESNIAPYGGGIYANTADAVELRRSYIGSNLSRRRGGGIDITARGTPAWMENLTVASNFVLGEAPEDAGGGIWLGGSGGLHLSTISGNQLASHPRDENSAAGVHFAGPGRFDLGSNVIAFNRAYPDLVDLGRSDGNVFASCNLVHSPLPQAIDAYDYHNLTHVDPLLQSPADNGGGSPTMAIAADSPARNQACDFAYTDQRGYQRRSATDSDLDMGAYEYGADRLFSDGFDG